MGNKQNVVQQTAQVAASGVAQMPLRFESEGRALTRREEINRKRIQALIDTGVYVGPEARTRAIPLGTLHFFNSEGRFYADIKKEEKPIPEYYSEAEKLKAKQLREQNKPIEEKIREEMQEQCPEKFALHYAFYRRLSWYLYDEQANCANVYKEWNDIIKDWCLEIGDRKPTEAEKNQAELRQQEMVERLTRAEGFTIGSLPGLPSEYGLFQVWRYGDDEIHRATLAELNIYLAYGIACKKWTVEEALFECVSKCSIANFYGEKHVQEAEEA